MAQNNLTVFQKLTRTFGFKGQLKKAPQFEFNKEALLKTDSREDFERAKLLAQQTQYISDKWAKLDQSLYNQSVYYEPNRLSAYYDYESMEFTPEISAALDIYAEESTTKSEKGDILTIHSDSKRIKTILDDLFNNVLDIHTNLPMWARGMCKYGDDFVYLKINPQKGVVGCQQMPNIEIERVEGARQSTPNQSDKITSSFPSRELRFAWKNKDMEFQAWEIAHFRLLGDDRKLPYGTCLKSDTHIKTKDGQKEIKNVRIGDEVYSFDTKTQKPVISKVLDTVNSGKKMCYKISTKHNYVDASEEHRIMYYDKSRGVFDYKNTLDFSVGDLLVVDPKSSNNHLIPIDKTKPEKNKNGYWNDIDFIPETVTKEFAELFGFLIGDGWISNNAIYIALGEHKTLNEKYINYLENFSNKKVKFHGGVEGKSQGICNSKMLKTILERMGFHGNVYTKRIPDWVYSSSDDIRRSFLDGLIDSDGSINIDKWNCLRYSIELSNEDLIKDIKLLVQSLGWKSGKITKRIRKNGSIYGRKFINQVNSFYFYFYESNVKQKIKYDIKDRLTNDFIIEPIISIEKIGEYETYDIYVEDNNHNFYANGVVVHNSMLDKIRRIWKQLLLAEDAMLIYRTSRAPERRVFKVFVGNMDDKDIEPYVQRIANKFKRDQVVDQKNGQVDMRYNQMPVWSQTPIPLLDGRTITIEELSKEYLEGKENWVYSVQDNTLDIVPGKVVWCDKNYTAKKLTKIWLDDNTWIMVAPEHPMMLRDGSYLPAEDLKPGTSLMPFYTKKSNDNIEGYDMVYNPSEDSYNFIHHLTDINGGDTTTITDGIDYTKHNHKVTRIETIHQNEDVYCMTVVGPNGEDDRHNFALKSFNSDGTISVSGSFTRNSVEQDFFIPVRDPNQPSPIETLPGAQNLAEIADIEYIQKKMLAALRIPKAFLGFEDVVGNGKGLALLDIRFARTINRIQQSLIQELNKIALVHLFILGFEDELSNFTLSMTNPSGQSDLLKIESWKEKITIYKDATSDNSQMGILPVSHTWAKKNILGMSNNEIILDLQQQRLERAIGVELQNSDKIIKRSGVFDEVDKKYGIPEEEREKVEAQMGRDEGQDGETPGGEVPEGFNEMGDLPPEPMNESRKDKILSMLNEDTPNVDDLFDMKKAQRNIYLMDKKIKEMLNE